MPQLNGKTFLFLNKYEAAINRSIITYAIYLLRLL